MSESDIIAAIGDYLAYKGHFFWRQNTNPIFREGHFVKMPKYAIRGVPDFILIRLSGIFCGIEVKAEKGRQSPDQKEFERRCKEFGGQYILAYSIDDVIAAGL